MICHIQGNVGESAKKPNQSAPIALILAPTRELTIQIQATINHFKKLFDIRSCAIYGGQERSSQEDSLLKGGGAHVVVATPGRLLDFIGTRTVRLHLVTYLVLDEADRMLAMGFHDQINEITSHIRPDRQCMLFTATFPGALRQAADAWIPEAVSIRCSTHDTASAPTSTSASEDLSQARQSPQEASHSNGPAAPAEDEATVPHGEVEVANGVSSTIGTTDAEDSGDHNLSSLTISKTIAQHVHVCAPHKKPRLLIKFIIATRAEEKERKVRQPGLMLIFVAKIKTIAFITEFLRKHEQGVGLGVLHSKLPQPQREATLKDFKAVGENRTSIILLLIYHIIGKVMFN